MLNVAMIEQVYIDFGHTDLRKSIDSLKIVVREKLELDPYSRCTIFVFSNRKRDKLKVLYWADNGFGLLYRKLETGKFSLFNEPGVALKISRRELNRLLNPSQSSEPE